MWMPCSYHTNNDGVLLLWCWFFRLYWIDSAGCYWYTSHKLEKYNKERYPPPPPIFHIKARQWIEQRETLKVVFCYCILAGPQSLDRRILSSIELCANNEERKQQHQMNELKKKNDFNIYPKKRSLHVNVFCPVKQKSRSWFKLPAG